MGCEICLAKKRFHCGRQNERLFHQKDRGPVATWIIKLLENWFDPPIPCTVGAADMQKKSLRITDIKGCRSSPSQHSPGSDTIETIFKPADTTDPITTISLRRGINYINGEIENQERLELYLK
jgi:hypothetical protein